MVLLYFCSSVMVLSRAFSLAVAEPLLWILMESPLQVISYNSSPRTDLAIFLSWDASSQPTFPPVEPLSQTLWGSIFAISRINSLPRKNSVSRAPGPSEKGSTVNDTAVSSEVASRMASGASFPFSPPSAAICSMAAMALSSISG